MRVSARTPCDNQNNLRTWPMRPWSWFFIGALVIASFYPDQIKVAAAIARAAPTWVWGLAALPAAFGVMLYCNVQRQAYSNVAGFCAEQLKGLEAESDDPAGLREVLRKHLVKNLWFAAISKWIGNTVLVAGGLIAVWAALQVLPTMR